MNEADVRNENRSSDESESTSDERREQGTRVPFEAAVEVGSAAGPSFEAHAIDVSEEGMHLKTAFLPEIGQPLTCRFETGPDSSVLASGEVVWRQEGDGAGEFGVRFTDLDDESAVALGKIATIADPAEKPIDQSGTKVRLHIEGLGSPMRARVKGANRNELTVGSELGFLQVGKELELEDAVTGKKRPARIDRVAVEIDPETKVPQLVVALKYEDVEGSDDCDVDVDEANAVDGDLESIEQASAQMKSAFARNVAKVTPALLATVKKMKIAALAYAEKKMKKEEDAAPKRMTAPPPAGALHATGRKVVRDEAQDAAPTGKFPLLIKKAEMHKKKIVIGAAAFALLLLFVIGTHKHTPEAVAPGAVAANADPNAPQTATTPAAAGGPVANDSTMANAANPLAQNQNPQTPILGGAMPLAIPPGNISSEQMGGPSVDPGNADQGDEPSEAHRKFNVVPFGSGGSIAHGNVLKIKMDGAIEKIEGAPQATGFSVVIPNRRSLEAAAPLAARDGRIASIKVTNDNGGAELNLQFKDGVPNYEVRARGDELEIVLAPIGGVAKHDASKDHPAAVANRAPTPKTHHPKKH